VGTLKQRAACGNEVHSSLSDGILLQKLVIAVRALLDRGFMALGTLMQQTWCWGRYHI